MFGEQQTIVKILHAGDVDRLLRILYRGTRPPLVRLFVCGCGRHANITRSDAEALGWQLLPHAACPACIAHEPYQGAEARERFIQLIDELAHSGRKVHDER